MGTEPTFGTNAIPQYKKDYNSSTNRLCKQAIKDVGSIHTFDLLGVNYCMNISVHTIAKWVHNPSLNFSVNAKVAQIGSVNAPAFTVQPII